MAHAHRVRRDDLVRLDESGIPVMLVGDSAGNCHLGYETTVPVTLDEMTMLSAAVVRGTSRALIVGDLPFGSYQEGPVQALRSATRLVKEAGVGAVKLEGGERSASRSGCSSSPASP
ncbi:3-methyl-2-oxobutanoate hydroxymethyltransferase [Streptomyces tendae]